MCRRRSEGCGRKSVRMCMADGIHERVFGPIGVEPRVSNILVPVTHSVLQGLFLSGGKSMNFQDMIFALDV